MVASSRNHKEHRFRFSHISHTLLAPNISLSGDAREKVLSHLLATRQVEVVNEEAVEEGDTCSIAAALHVPLPAQDDKKKAKKLKMLGFPNFQMCGHDWLCSGVL